MFKFRYTEKALASIKGELDTREDAIDLKGARSLAHQVGMQMLRRGQRSPLSIREPKALWDAYIPAEPELLEEVPPSSRWVRRARRRDSEAFARKSRRSAFRRRQTEHQVEQNFRGQARVYFGLSPDVSDAMQANVVGAVRDLAETLSTRDGIPYTRALEQVEEKMRELLVAYGDLDEEAAA